MTLVSRDSTHSFDVWTCENNGQIKPVAASVSSLDHPAVASSLFELSVREFTHVVLWLLTTSSPDIRCGEGVSLAISLGTLPIYFDLQLIRVACSSLKAGVGSESYENKILDISLTQLEIQISIGELQRHVRLLIGYPFVREFYRSYSLHQWRLITTSPLLKSGSRPLYISAPKLPSSKNRICCCRTWEVVIWCHLW